MEIETVIKQINVEPIKLFRPVLSGLLLNAFYSLLLLKKSSGTEIMPEFEEETMQEVMKCFGQIDQYITETLNIEVPKSP